MVAYAAVAWMPGLLLLAADLLDPAWALAALIWISPLTWTADRLLAGVSLVPTEKGGSWGRVIPSGIAFLHIPLMGLGVHQIALVEGWTWKGVLFLAHGLQFGQVAVPAAHELIHRRSRWERRLGAAVFTSLLFGHHATAHPAVHHVWVATPQDPNTPQRGESFWHFWPRAWTGSFRAGLAVEARRMRHLGRSAFGPGNRYWFYVAGGVASLGLASTLAGLAGGLVWGGLALHAQMQLLLSDYVQHYGLERRLLPSGRYEPVAPAHSWDAPPPFSRLMMLNAPSHADHHLHPARMFHALVEPKESGAPLLPFSLPVAATIALFPRLWRRIIDPRLDDRRKRGRESRPGREHQGG